MSEKHSPHQEQQEKESFKHDELLQFEDMSMVIGFRTPGDLIRWREHKYADPENSTVNTVLVTTKGGKHLVLGNDTVVELPELDRKTGKFGNEGQKVLAAKLEDAAPNGLDDIVIGEPWSLTGTIDPIKSVLLDYKSTSPGYMNAEQIGGPSPMESAREHLHRVVEAMHDANPQ